MHALTGFINYLYKNFSLLKILLYVTKCIIQMTSMSSYMHDFLTTQTFCAYYVKLFD